MFNIEESSLPEIYIRNGKECYLDSVRKKLVYITPEETVRQKVISFLVNELKVPKQMIAVEEHLSHYGLESKRRADIIIHKYVREENLKEPVAVIECKAPHIALDENANTQMTDYADKLLCAYAVLTNGYSTFIYRYDNEKDKYVQLSDLPKYEDMLKGKYDVLEEPVFPKRTPFEKLEEMLPEYIGLDIGTSTSVTKQIPILNMWETLLDTKVQLSSKKYKIFKLIKDYGVRILSYGNASGGMFSGPYRSFLIEYKGSTEFVSIGLSVYVTWTKQDIEKTVLNVAIDNEKETHHSLQLVLDDNMSVVGNKCTFYHHGRIGVGKIGSGRIDELRKFVENEYSQIIEGNRFCLGTLYNDALFQLDSESMTDFIENLISYALIRDEYRKYVKKNRE